VDPPEEGAVAGALEVERELDAVAQPPRGGGRDLDPRLLVDSCMWTLPWVCSIGGSPPRDFTRTRPQYSPSAAPAGMATMTRTTWRCPGWSTRRRGKTRR
jgi:hypothetical protein